jgi:hypothetical protein
VGGSRRASAGRAKAVAGMSLEAIRRASLAINLWAGFVLMSAPYQREITMAKFRYGVDFVEDHLGRLRECLNETAELNGRVVNVLWLPARTVSFQGDNGENMQKSGPSHYIVVSEYEAE